MRPVSPHGLAVLSLPRSARGVRPSGTCPGSLSPRSQLRARGLFMQSVVITGASTGIGFACAKLLYARGYRVFGSVRKQADADRLAGELGSNFTPLLFDVTDEAAVLAAGRRVREALDGKTLSGLVNN